LNDVAPPHRGHGAIVRLSMDSPRSHHLGLSLGASEVPKMEDLSSAEELESNLPLEYPPS